MEEIKLNKWQTRKLSNSKSLVPNKKIYIRGNDLYKIYTFDPNEVFSLFDRETFVDRNQIEYLSSMRKNIKLSHLPRGIISTKKDDIGVIYDYFEGYNSFTLLHEEDKEIIFNNIKCAIDAINELICYEIYNSDLVSQNILYKGKKVELIDLDGPYIGSDYLKIKNMYRYFLDSILDILTKKIESQYNKEDTKRILVDIRKILHTDHTYISDISTQQIDKIESLKLIK